MAGLQLQDMEYMLEPVHQKLHNPWSGAAQSVYEPSVPDYASTIYCSAQPVLDKNGNLFCGHMNQQIQESFDTLEAVLKRKGYELKDVGNIHFYTTSLKDFFREYDFIVKRLQPFGSVPFTTVKEVKALSFPSLLFELEATATK